MANTQSLHDSFIPSQQLNFVMAYPQATAEKPLYMRLPQVSFES